MTVIIKYNNVVITKLNLNTIKEIKNIKESKDHPIQKLIIILFSLKIAFPVKSNRLAKIKIIKIINHLFYNISFINCLILIYFCKLLKISASIYKL